MEVQIKKGFLDTAILAALVREDSYGYKIVQDVRNVVEISESTLYPILRRLEGAGCLATYSTQHGGRLRKYYRITPAGKRKIRTFLEDFKEITAIYNFIAYAAAEVYND
jgi:PadR family transcriptional regulator PadR